LTKEYKKSNKKGHLGSAQISWKKWIYADVDMGVHQLC
jgi:hypothetical protein